MSFTVIFTFLSTLSLGIANKRASKKTLLAEETGCTRSYALLPMDERVLPSAVESIFAEGMCLRLAWVARQEILGASDSHVIKRKMGPAWGRTTFLVH